MQRMEGGYFKMIFITLGTQDKTFERLLIKIDEMINKGIIQEEVIVQAGYTKYKSKNMEIFDFIDMNQFNSYIERADKMITHAGVGSIINGINNGIPVLAVARRVKYGEHENDHQVEITNKFIEQQYILGCLEVEEVEEQFALLEKFSVKPYASNNEQFCEVIGKIIDL